MRPLAVPAPSPKAPDTPDWLRKSAVEDPMAT